MPRLVPLLSATILVCLPVAARAQQIQISGSNLAQAVECDGGDAVIRGNDNQLTLHGACRSLLLEGNGNQVHAQMLAGAPIELRGNGNDVAYRVPGGAEPLIHAAGVNNQIGPEGGPRLAHAGPTPRPDQAPPPPIPDSALVLREENARRDVLCNGRDVVVEGNGDEYTLQGGCRSLTVRGEGLMIQVEMQPGGRILLQGNGNTVQWRVPGGGAPPLVSVNGEGSRVVQSANAPAVAVPRGYAASQTRLPAASLPALVPIPVPVSVAMPAPSGSQSAPPSAPVQPVVHAGGKPAGPALLVRADHEARDMDCAGRDVKITANYALIVLRGGCRSVTLKGGFNRMQIALAGNGRLDVDGVANTVLYALADDASPPALAIKGNRSTARRIARLGQLPQPQAQVQPQQGGDHAATATPITPLHQPLTSGEHVPHGVP